MAEIKPVKAMGHYTWLWEAVTEADTFGVLPLDLGSDATFYVDDTGGSWGGASMEILGSLKAAGAFYQLSDPLGTLISFTAASQALETIQQNVNYVKPQMTGGTSVVLDVYIKLGGNK